MKKFLCIVLSCILILSLCGCKKNTDFEDLTGEWHEAISGRGSMTVTLVDGNPYFEVVWSDSATTYHEFNFLTTPTDDGKLVYDAGFKGIVECDEEGNETKTILDEEASGTVEITDDGSLIWTEDDVADDPHQFVR